MHGSFTSGDEVLLGSWSTDSGFAGEGSYEVLLSGIELSPSIAAGSRIAIYWFSGLSLGVESPSAGDAYGFYSDPAWVIPADGALAVSYTLETESIGGSIPNSMALASFVVSAVPEPSTFGLLFGLSALGWVTCRRGKRA